LFYATGGLAYGQVNLTGVTNIANISFAGINLPGAGRAAFSASRTNVGWTAGAGIEGRFAWLPMGWTWKLEYLYVDLGSLDTVASSTSPTFGIPGFFVASLGATTTHTHFTDNIVRVGLNYQFH
jgi:outer membrane immunogenic protein